ncbi:MAG: molecular chaperone [Halothermotrichaceae bacterium]
MKQRFFKQGFFILLLLFCVFFSCIASASVRVEPSRFIFIVDPGERVTGSIKVTNNGEETLELSAALYDWTIDEENQPLMFKEGKLDSSLQGTIKFNPRQFTLEPGETQIVRFTVKAGDNQIKEKRGIVFFEHDYPLVENKTGARIVAQVGSNIYLISTKTKFNFKLEKVDIDTDTNENMLLNLDLKNNGDAHIRATGNYKIIDDKGVLSTKGSITKSIILPSMKSVLKIPLEEKLAEGKYKVILTFNFHGIKESFTYDEVVEIK